MSPLLHLVLPDLRRMAHGTRDMVEPDAENYSCEACGEDEVFGVEQLLIRGELEIS